jgi:hypothetical protein
MDIYIYGWQCKERKGGCGYSMVDTGVVVDMELDCIRNLVNTDPEVWKNAPSEELKKH